MVPLKPMQDILKYFTKKTHKIIFTPVLSYKVRKSTPPKEINYSLVKDLIIASFSFKKFIQLNIIASHCLTIKSLIWLYKKILITAK